MFKRLLTFVTHRIYNLPIIVMMPHSRCNCRCVMCDIWKANHDKREISVEELQRHTNSFKKLGVREIVFSGGEALMHSNLWKFCEILNDQKINVTLLSTGLLLEKHAYAIIKHCKEVIVSLDGSEQIHDKIRRIPNGFSKLSDGVQALKKLKPGFRVTGRCVLQRYNFTDFPNIIQAAKSIGLDQISFLAADISTPAFNRPDSWENDRVSEIALARNEVEQFAKIVEQSFVDLKQDYDSKFIAENPAKMNKIVQYYSAINGEGEFPETVCNAPWVSAVIESDGSVMPCFFHKPYGNIFDNNLIDILNSKQAISFRKSLNMEKDSICSKCVCSLKLGVTQMN